MSDTPKQPDLTSEDKPKVRKEIPVFAIQDDDAIMAQEMADLFEEDKVSSPARQLRTGSGRISSVPSRHLSTI